MSFTLLTQNRHRPRWSNEQVRRFMDQAYTAGKTAGKQELLNIAVDTEKRVNQLVVATTASSAA